MENTLAKSTRALALALLLGALAPATPALAQTGTDTGVTTTQAGDDRDDDKDWGWIGLLGLLGLAGLMKKDHHRDDVNRR